MQLPDPRPEAVRSRPPHTPAVPTPASSRGQPPKSPTGRGTLAVYASARTTATAAIRADHRVLFVIRVTVDANRHETATRTSTRVLRVGDWLEMRGVDAVPNSTKVI